MPLRLGDRNESVREWRRVMNARFGGLYTRLHGPLPTDTDEFGPRAEQWQREYELRTYQPVDGVVSDDDLRALRIPLPPEKPWIITIGGHLGTWDTGPAFWSALPLHQQGRVTLQGVGYDAVSIPFNNRSGFVELDRIVNHVKPPGVPYAIGSHSQGAIIASDFIEQRVLTNPSNPAYANFRGGVQFGNPRRPRGVVAPWITDPPPAGSEGLAHNALPAKLPGVEEASRRGDLYADKTPGPAAEYKTAIYRIVAEGSIFGRDSLIEQLIELGVTPYSELWPVFQAIIGGIQFAVNMDPHNVFDLRPATDHFARVLGV